MSNASDRNRRYLPYVILLGLIFVPISVMIVAQIRHGQQTRELELGQQAFLQDVKRIGGHIVQTPAGPRDAFQPVISVDLSGATIDGDILNRLSEFTTIERLNLDGAVLEREDYRTLDHFPKLRNLSLNGSTFSDEDLPFESLQLTALSLRSTAITDDGLSRLTGMTSLANVDISDTAVTDEGLKSLSELTSLKTLELDEDCITPDGVMALQSVKLLQVVRVHVADGLGQQAKEFVSPLAASCAVRAIRPGGSILWDAEARWDETPAGVVDIVAHEVGLDAQQAEQFLTAMESADFTRVQPRSDFTLGPSGPVRRKPPPEPAAEPISSVDEFLERLTGIGYPPNEVRAFARDRFTPDDIPKLLAKLQAEPNCGAPTVLCCYGAFLLVRDGMNNPAAVEQLTRMLTHEDPRVRGITVYGFSEYGHPFNEDWKPSEQAVEFGLPHLIRLANDPVASVQLAANEVLGDVVYHYPDRAAEVLPVLIAKLTHGQSGYVDYSIKKIVEVNPEAARVFIPQLRRQLDDFYAKPPSNAPTRMPSEGQNSGPDLQISLLKNVFLQVVATDPELSHEIAREQLQLMRAGKTGGDWIPKLFPEYSEAVREIVGELLDISNSDNPMAADSAKQALVGVALTIRDYHMTKDASR